MQFIQQRLELAEKRDEDDYASYAILEPENDKIVFAVEINQSKIKDSKGNLPKDILVTINTNL